MFTLGLTFPYKRSNKKKTCGEKEWVRILLYLYGSFPGSATNRFLRSARNFWRVSFLPSLALALGSGHWGAVPVLLGTLSAHTHAPPPRSSAHRAPSCAGWSFTVSLTQVQCITSWWAASAHRHRGRAQIQSVESRKMLYLYAWMCVWPANKTSESEAVIPAVYTMIWCREPIPCTIKPTIIIWSTFTTSISAYKNSYLYS